MVFRILLEFDQLSILSVTEVFLLRYGGSKSGATGQPWEAHNHRCIGSRPQPIYLQTPL